MCLVMLQSSLGAFGCTASVFETVIPTANSKRLWPDITDRRRFSSFPPDGRAAVR